MIPTRKVPRNALTRRMIHRISEWQYLAVLAHLGTPLLLMASTLLIGGIGYYLIEGGEVAFIDCLYMTIVTLSTVGFGEHIPIATVEAKVFTMVLMIFGIGVIAYTISMLTAFLVEGQLTGILRRLRMEARIKSLEDHYIVCGGGETGYHVIEELCTMGYPVVLVEHDEECLERYTAMPNLLVVEGDAAEDDNLKRAGIKRARGMVIALPSDKDNLFVTVSARHLSDSVRIVAKGVGPKMRDKLMRAGANSVVSPNMIGGLRLASELIRPSVVGFLDKMLRQSDRTWRIGEIEVAAGSTLEGKPLKESGLKEEHDLLVLAFMYRESGGIDFNPPDSHPIPAGATLVVMGEVERILRVRELCQK